MIYIGPAGNSQSFYNEGHTKTIETPLWLKNRGLNAFEYSFGKGYTLSSQTALEIGAEFKKHGINLSLHAPYYINFANSDPEMYEKTKGYIRTGIKFLRLMGAERLVFHPGSVGKLSRDEAFNLCKNRLKQFVKELEEEGLLDGIYLCPETMGKSMQLGTISEILELCTLNEHLLPTFDFGHINALTQGSLKSPSDYEEIIDKTKEALGEERTKILHVHFSKIQFGLKGEIKHLTFADKTFGPNFEDFAEVIKKYGLNVHIICESAGTQAEDAIIMKNILG